MYVCLYVQLHLSGTQRIHQLSFLWHHLHSFYFLDVCHIFFVLEYEFFIFDNLIHVCKISWSYQFNYPFHIFPKLSYTFYPTTSILHQIFILETTESD